MRAVRALAFVCVSALVTVACGGTYHPDNPDQAILIQVEGTPDGDVVANPDVLEPGANPTTGTPAGPSVGTPQQPGPNDPVTGPTDVGSDPDDPGDDRPTFRAADVGGTRVANESGTITLGIVAPLSGPIALQGLATTRGVQATIAEYNARGGIHGHEIELIVEDDQFDPVQGRRYVQKLINEDQVFAIMGLLTPATFAQSLPDVDNSGTIMMLGDGAASTGGSRLVFPSYQQCNTALRNTAEYAINDLGLERVAIVQIDIEVARACADAAAGKVRELGGQVVYRAGTIPGGFSCDSQVQGAADANAQTIILMAETLTLIRCAESVKNAGLDMRIGTSSNAVDDPALIEALGGDAEGIYGASGFLPSWHPTTRALCTDNIERYYPGDGATQYLGYAACVGTRILLDALLVLGPEATQAEVVGYLERGEPYDTNGMAPPIVYSRDSHEPYNRLYAMEVRNGRWEITREQFVSPPS